MSAESTIAFFGIRFDVPETEVEELELRRHPLIAKARTASIQHYWANFGGVDPKYVLLLGRKLSTIGFEDAIDYTVSQGELVNIMEDVRRKLQAAGFDQEPELIIQILPSP
jgi:hypothetical protein